MADIQTQRTKSDKDHYKPFYIIIQVNVPVKRVIASA